MYYSTDVLFSSSSSLACAGSSFSLPRYAESAVAQLSIPDAEKAAAAKALEEVQAIEKREVAESGLLVAERSCVR